MEKPVIIIGGGGHAKVLFQTLNLLGRKVLGYTDPNSPSNYLKEFEHMGDDSEIDRFHPHDICLVNGIGFSSNINRRKKIYKYFKQKGYYFPPVIHPHAIVATDVKIEEGAQVMVGAIIQPNVTLECNTIVNTKASIDHDTFIGPHSFIAPGVTICGNVYIGSESLIGAGSTIIQGVKINNNCTVGAGSVVVRDVVSNEIVLGVPAKTKNSIRGD